MEEEEGEGGLLWLRRRRRERRAGEEMIRVWRGGGCRENDGKERVGFSILACPFIIFGGGVAERKRRAGKGRLKAVIVGVCFTSEEPRIIRGERKKYLSIYLGE